MKLTATLWAVTLLTLTTQAATGVEGPETAARSAALEWLQLVDAGNYAQSWSTASALFRQQVSEAQWQSAAMGVRAPLGAVKSRRVMSADFMTVLPGAPAGQYVVVRFDSSFEHRSSAVETVTPMKDSDGKWRVSGYYIK